MYPLHSYIHYNLILIKGSKEGLKKYFTRDKLTLTKDSNTRKKCIEKKQVLELAMHKERGLLCLFKQAIFAKFQSGI